MPTNINSLSITSDIIFQNQGVTLDPPFEGQIKIYAKSDNKLYFRAGPNGAEAPLGINTGDSFNWTGTNTFTNASTVNFNGYVNVYGGIFNYTSNYNSTNGYGFNIGGLQKNTASVYGVVSLWGVTSNTWFMPTTNVTNVASISATNYFTPAYTQTITNAIGYYADLRADLSDGGSVTNLYGLYIAPMSTATNNYSAYFGNSVGIGTANPSTLLHVSSANTQTEITIESTVAASRSTLKLLTNGNDWEVGARGSSLAPNNAFYIYDLTAGAYRAVIDSSGNVGIGTTSPDALFHVKSTTAWTQPMFESTLSTGGASVLLKSDYTTWQLAARGSANDTAAGSFSIYDSTANAIRMFINTSGQTGVGRIPSVPLDVEGWGRFVTPGIIGATNHGSTGGLIIRASAGSNDINYLQFVNNAGTSQYYHLLVKSDSRMYTSGPLSVDVGEVSVSSGVGDNFVLRTKTNTPNPNWTIGYGNGSGAVDTTREHLVANAGTISLNSGNLSVTGSTTLGSYLGIGSSSGQTGGTRFTVHESTAKSSSTAIMPNQKIRWTWYNDADGAIVGTRQYQLWVYPYSNQSGSLAIFDAVMQFSVPTYTETVLNVSSVVSGTRYVITSLGNTSQIQWNAMAGSSGNTYAVNDWFNAAANGPAGTTGTVISFAYTKQIVMNAPTILNNSLSMSGVVTISSATTIDSNTYMIVAGGTSSYAVTLPSTSVVSTGRIYVIKKTSASTYTLTINTTSSQTIDGATSLAFTQQYASYTVISNGSNWLII